MRATMSLPLIFPPVEFDGHVLVDGGAMNNVPADVVTRDGRGPGHRRQRRRPVRPGVDKINYSLLGLAGQTLDAMMRANSLKALASADVVINVPLAAYGSLDWRRYRAADRGRLQGRGGDARSPSSARRGRRGMAGLGVGTGRAAQDGAADADGVVSGGAGKSDDRLMRQLLSTHVGKPLDVPSSTPTSPCWLASTGISR